MCSTCGCGHGEVRIDGKPADAEGGHWHRHEDGTRHSHDHGDACHHEHGHEHRHDEHHRHGHKHHHHGHHHKHHGHEGHAHRHAHDGGQEHDHWHHHDHAHDHSHEKSGESAALGGPLGAVHAGHLSPSRIVAVERDILEHNDAIARQNRQRLADQGVFALNLVSSPGSGKTTLLVRTLEMLKAKVPCAVIEGDQQTQNDAERVRRTGVAAVQINTGKGCHLDARMVAQALDRLPLSDNGLLFIENVGNLVCPAAFDLGEAHKVAILSVTEGADKPLKYPDMFHAAEVLLINKIDLLPHVDFDVEQAIAYARQIQPKLVVMKVSATSGEGMPTWLDWLQQGVSKAKQTRDNDLQALRKKVEQLQAQLEAQRQKTS